MLSASISLPVHQPERRGWMWWLPAHGYGNGLDDRAWIPVLEVDARIVAPLLEAFGEAYVLAYAATTRLHEDLCSTEQWPTYRVWAGASAYGRAEDTLIAVMPRLVRGLCRHREAR